MIVDQYRTEDVLRKHLAAYGVQVELETEPIAAEQDAECVTVTLKKGSAEEEKLRVAYVIGCDGARGKDLDGPLHLSVLT